MRWIKAKKGDQVAFGRSVVTIDWVDGNVKQITLVNYPETGEIIIRVARDGWSDIEVCTPERGKRWVLTGRLKGLEMKEAHFERKELAEEAAAYLDEFEIQEKEVILQ